MADLLENSILEAKWIYQVNGQTLMNVFHYQLPVQVNNVDPVLVTDSFLNFLSNAGGGSIIEDITNIQGTNVSWVKATAQIVWPVRYIMREAVVLAAGTGGATCTAQNVQCSIMKRGERADRHNVGGFHIGGLASNQYSNGLVTAPCLAKMQDVADGLSQDVADGVTGQQWEPVILNKLPVPNTDPVKYKISGGAQILSWLPLQPLRVMNRRTVGRGI